MGNFKQSEMLYDDWKHYKWSAPADGDNPNIRGGKDHDELNRTEGFEVLPLLTVLEISTGKTLQTQLLIKKLKK